MLSSSHRGSIHEPRPRSRWPFRLSEDRGVMFPWRLDRALTRRIGGGHVETDESSTALFPLDAHRRMRLSDGTPNAFEARPGGISDAKRTPDESEDWSADESSVRRPLSSSSDSSEDEYKTGVSFTGGNRKRRSLLRARRSLELHGEDVSSDNSSNNGPDEPVLVGRSLADLRSRLRGETAPGPPPLQVGHVTATDDKDGAPPAARRGRGGFAGLPVRRKAWRRARARGRGRGDS
jgi:hypothetical protein